MRALMHRPLPRSARNREIGIVSPIFTRLARPALPLPLLLLALFLSLPLLCPPPAAAQGFHFSALLSALASTRFDALSEPTTSFRFIPEIKFSTAPDRPVTFDGELSANAYGMSLFYPDRGADLSGDIKPYRAWLRLSTSRFEARAGLQKVSFGSAILFRPMMWFDTLDPRDPLQLTDGVNALLLRFYTNRNANFWAWAMVGNKGARGFDLAPPDKKTPEFGGRVQVPLFKGELGATYHRRKAAVDGLVPLMLLPPGSPLPIPPVPEDRVGLDGKWDIGIGVWLEGALVHQQTTLLPLPYQLALTAGLDYTFGLGNGLTALAEHFRIESSARAFARGESLDFSALLLRYPLGLLDELSGIFYYDWRNRDAYRFVTWRRTTDALSFNVILFWNPEGLPALPGQPASSSFAGKGFQLLLAYHF